MVKEQVGDSLADKKMPEILDEEDAFTKAAQDTLHAIFLHYDRDRDGALNNEELSSFVSHTNSREGEEGEEGEGQSAFSKEELEEMTVFFNCTAEGFLTWEGFKEMYQLQSLSEPLETRRDFVRNGHTQWATEDLDGEEEEVVVVKGSDDGSKKNRKVEEAKSAPAPIDYKEILLNHHLASATPLDAPTNGNGTPAVKKGTILFEFPTTAREEDSIRILYTANFLYNLLHSLAPSSASLEIQVIPVSFKNNYSTPPGPGAGEGEEDFNGTFKKYGLFKKEGGNQLKFISPYSTTTLPLVGEDKVALVRQGLSLSSTSSKTACPSTVYCVFSNANEFHWRKAIEEFNADTTSSSSPTLEIKLYPVFKCTTTPSKSSAPVKATPSTSIDTFLSTWFTNSFTTLERNNPPDASEQITRALGKSNCLFFLLSFRLAKSVKFFEAVDSEIGVHIQYSHARLSGIRRTLREKDLLSTLARNRVAHLNSHLPSILLQTPKVAVLVDMMSQFPSILEKSLADPSYLLIYLTSFSKKVSSLYYHLRIKGEAEDVQGVRWTIFECSLDILARSILILGVDPIEEI